MTAHADIRIETNAANNLNKQCGGAGVLQKSDSSRDKKPMGFVAHPEINKSCEKCMHLNAAKDFI